MTRRCRGCGHVLRRPSLDGYGPVCRARMLPAAPSPTRTPTARHTGAHTPAQPTLEDTMTDTTDRDARYRIGGLVADYCTSTDQHTAHEWGGTATPERFHCPGFPAHLEAQKAAAAADDAAMQVLSEQGAQCGSCGDEPGDRNCPDCERCRGWYVDALRKAGWAPRAEVLREAAKRLEDDDHLAAAAELREMTDEARTATA